MKLYCQNPLCHEDKTKDRLRGIGDNKLYTTRKASEYYNKMFCTQSCFHEYFEIFKERILEVIGVQGKRQCTHEDRSCFTSYCVSTSNQRSEESYPSRYSDEYKNFRTQYVNQLMNRSENE